MGWGLREGWGVGGGRGHVVYVRGKLEIYAV